MPRNGAPTRERILDAAERLVIDRGYAGTSVDQVITASGTSKGSFFHHYASKQELAQALVERYAAADVAHLRSALEETADLAAPADRLIAFLRIFETGADELMAAQSSCLYVALLTERGLTVDETRAEIESAVRVWRSAIADLLTSALAGSRGVGAVDVEAWADHVFTTFEGAFILCRATGDTAHMGRQLRVLRQQFEALLGRLLDT